jgi:hypothetical protein
VSEDIDGVVEVADRNQMMLELAGLLLIATVVEQADSSAVTAQISSNAQSWLTETHHVLLSRKEEALMVN